MLSPSMSCIPPRCIHSLALVVLLLVGLALGVSPAAATPQGGNGALVTGGTNSDDTSDHALFIDGVKHEAIDASGENGAASPDGKWLIVPIVSGSVNFVIMRSNGTDVRNLVLPASGGYPSVTVAGHETFAFLDNDTFAVTGNGYVAVVRAADLSVIARHTGLWVGLGSAGGGPGVFTNCRAMDSTGALYFSARFNTEIRFFKLPLGSTAATQFAAGMVIRSESGFRDPCPNDVDGTASAVVYATQDEGVVEVSTTTGARQVIQPPGEYWDPIFSPDGRLVHVAAETGTGNTCEVRSVPRVGRGATPSTSSVSNWCVQPVAQLPVPATPNLTLTGSQFIGDVIEIDLAYRNTTSFTFRDLVVENGGANGIVLNNLGYSEPYRAGYQALAGPTPALPAVLGPGATHTSQYLVNATSPGYFTVRASLAGERDPGSGRFDARSNYLTVHVAPRTPEEWERFMLMTGGYLSLVERQQQRVAGEVDRTIQLVNKQISLLPGLTKAEKAALVKATPSERALARALGLDQDALGWLPNDPNASLKLAVEFQKARLKARYTAFGTELKTQGSKVTYAAKFWNTQLNGPPSARVAIMPILMEGPANKLVTLESWASRAGEISAQPDAVDQFAALTSDTASKMWSASRNQVRTSLYNTVTKRNQLVRQLQTDPAAGMRSWGAAVGRGEAQGAIALTKQVVGPDLGKILSVAKAGAATLKKRGVPDIDFSAPHLDGADLDDALPGRPPTVEATGMGRKDQETAKRVIADVEQEVFDATGQRIELQMTFRERNAHSSALGDSAMGKIGLFTTKAGTDVDVMLGMDPRALGKAVYYKPTLPAYFNTLDDDLKHSLIARRSEMLSQWHSYTAPKSAARKAATRAGTTYTNKGPNGMVTSTIKVKTDEVYLKNGTITLKYRELTVDGIRVVTAKKPKWVASDYDGNSVRLRSGDTLPAGISGMAQLKLNRRLIQAARDDGFSYGMHGFSFNAIDLTSDPSAKFGQRDVVKFLLANMRGADRERMLKDYLSKYGPSDYMDLLAKSETGKYLIKVTSSDVETTTGL